MTPMKTRLYITIIMISLLLLGVVRAASAQDIVAGVAPGNEFTYSVTGSYSSGAPIAQVPEEVISAQASDYFKVTILNVSGADVGYLWFWHFKNGTDQSGDGTVNLETTGNTGPFWAIVSANLTAGERIHPHFGPDLSTFNETVMWTYTNYTRETNRLQLDFAYQNQNNPQSTYTEHTDTYFDKQTGMLVQLSDVSNYVNPTFTATVEWKLREQNVWTYSSSGSFAPEPLFSLPVIIAIVVVVAIVVIILGVVVSNKGKAAKRKELLKKR